MEGQRKPKRWGLWLVAGLVSFTFYLLMLGPVKVAMRSGYLSPQCREVLSVSYRPVTFLVSIVPKPVGDCYLRYVESWKNVLRTL